MILADEKMVHVIKEDSFALIDLISKLRQLGKVSETGENISSAIMSAINSAGLPLNCLMGQCYNRAACMRCMNIGVVAFI